MSYSPMAKIYAARIKKGRIAIDDVPEELREEVQEILDGDDKR